MSVMQQDMFVGMWYVVFLNNMNLSVYSYYEVCLGQEWQKQNLASLQKKRKELLQS